MSKAKIVYSFGTNMYNDTELVSKTFQITDLMATNPEFDSLSQDVMGLKATNQNFESLVYRSGFGDRNIIGQKNSARNDTENLLGSIAIKVQTLCNGDELMMRNSGFDLKRKSEPVGELDQPTNVIAIAGTRVGTIDVSWNVVPNAKMYEVTYTPYPITANSVWSWFTCSKHTATIENLPELTKYCIKVAGAGADPRRVWSDIITGSSK